MNDKELALYIGSRIRELRKNKGLTQKELASLVNMGDTTIANYEKGFRTPKKNTLFRLANALSVTIDDLFPPINEKQKNRNEIPTSPLVNKITKTVVELNTQRKKQVLDYAERQLDEQKSENIEYFEVIATTRLSAGLGYAFNEYDQEKVYVENKPPKYDLASLVYGDSMEPKFQSGELVYLVDKGLSSYSGEICAVAYDGETFIKRVYTEAGKLRLVSLNPKYDDIVIDFPPKDGGFIRIYEVVGSDMTVTIK
ncbi:TPA: helix-turn-helix transcriptional regulator [Streptococcus agalactiae]|nr:helix-turn-helix transcriptional regulator [Streptococcus agalactiae]